MATMLGFLTTDARVEPRVLAGALRRVTDETFNAITVDGECSTNDCVFLLASGASGVVVERDDDPALLEGLRAVAGHLAREIVRGGEGATKLVTIRVTGAASLADAWLAARTIANSPLVKTAIHGGDPNWGRLIAAAGRSGAAFVLDHASVSIGPVAVFVDGVPHDERADEAAAVLTRQARHDCRRPRHRRRGGGDDVDVRLQRRVRAHQRGVPDMSNVTKTSGVVSPRRSRRNDTRCRRPRTSCRPRPQPRRARSDARSRGDAQGRPGGWTPRPTGRSPASTSRCCSKSRRCGRGRRSSSPCASSAAT